MLLLLPTPVNITRLHQSNTTPPIVPGLTAHVRPPQPTQKLLLTPCRQPLTNRTTLATKHTPTQPLSSDREPATTQPTRSSPCRRPRPLQHRRPTPFCPTALLWKTDKPFPSSRSQNTEQAMVITRHFVLLGNKTAYVALASGHNCTILKAVAHYLQRLSA